MRGSYRSTRIFMFPPWTTVRTSLSTALEAVDQKFTAAGVRDNKTKVQWPRLSRESLGNHDG